MPSTQNLVVLVRLCGNVLAVTQRGTGIRIRVVATLTKGVRVPDQSGALALLPQLTGQRQEGEGGHLGGPRFAAFWRDQHLRPLEQAMRYGFDLAGGLNGGNPASTRPTANARLRYVKYRSRAPLAAGPLTEVVEVRHGGDPCTFCKALQAPDCERVCQNPNLPLRVAKGVTVALLKELESALGVSLAFLMDIEDVAQTDDERALLAAYRQAAQRDKDMAKAAVQPRD